MRAPLLEQNIARNHILTPRLLRTQSLPCAVGGFVGAALGLVGGVAGLLLNVLGDCG